MTPTTCSLILPFSLNGQLQRDHYIQKSTLYQQKWRLETQVFILEL
jgi:hypothetical protein